MTPVLNGLQDTGIGSVPAVVGKGVSARES